MAASAVSTASVIMLTGIVVRTMAKAMRRVRTLCPNFLDFFISFSFSFLCKFLYLKRTGMRLFENRYEKKRSEIPAPLIEFMLGNILVQHPDFIPCFCTFSNIAPVIFTSGAPSFDVYEGCLFTFLAHLIHISFNVVLISFDYIFLPCVS